MEILTIDEKNKKRIQEYLHGPWTFSYGYESDIELLEQNNQLTERFAQKIFKDIIHDCHIKRETLEPNGELKEEISQVYDKFDCIPKRKGDMDFEGIYKNMQTCFELLEVDKKYDKIIESRRIAESVIASIDAKGKLDIRLDESSSNDLLNIKSKLEKALQSEKTDIGVIQECINKYNEYALQIWNDYLTNVENGKEKIKKIPNKFYKMIEEERNMDYTPAIQEPLEKCRLMNETIIILGLIYRDFLCSLDERKKLQEKDARELQEVEKTIEQEIREKYNPDDIFKKRNQNNIEESNNKEENTNMIAVQKEKWYQKIFNIIKNIFIIKK